MLMMLQGNDCQSRSPLQYGRGNYSQSWPQSWSSSLINMMIISSSTLTILSYNQSLAVWESPGSVRERIQNAKGEPWWSFPANFIQSNSSVRLFWHIGKFCWSAPPSPPPKKILQDLEKLTPGSALKNKSRVPPWLKASWSVATQSWEALVVSSLHWFRSVRWFGFVRNWIIALQFHAPNSVQLVADESAKTFTAEDEKTDDSSSVVANQKILDGFGEKLGEATSGGVASSMPLPNTSDTNRAKNSAMSLDDQLLGKPQNIFYIRPQRVKRAISLKGKMRKKMVFGALLA